MSVELENISRQLDETGYPVAGLVIRTFTKALKSRGLLPDRLPGSETASIEDNKFRGTEVICRLLETARDGPYVNATVLEWLGKKFDFTEGSKYNIRHAVLDIKEKGNDSLCHLAIPTRASNFLFRGDIGSITKLRNAIASGAIYKVRGLGKERIVSISDALTRFDELVRAENKK